MNSHLVLFFCFVAVFVAVLISIALYSFRRARRSSPTEWDDLIRRLAFVDRNSIREIALDVIDESGEPRRDSESAILESNQIWAMAGGWKGIEALEQNCRVLIDLAFYVQQWYPEAVAVTEQLRLSAREIEWHVSRLKVARQTGKLESTIPMYAQQAIATYYMMTRRVLDLYEKGNQQMLVELQRAL